jgi:thioredoxin 1
MATAQTNGKVLHVDQAQFDQVVLQSEVPVLVDFYADWCGPCRALAPALDQLAQEAPEAKVVKVNVDDNQELALRYRINAIPALMVFDGGRITAQHAGMASVPQLKSLLSQ